MEYSPKFKIIQKNGYRHSTQINQIKEKSQFYKELISFSHFSGIYTNKSHLKKKASKNG